MVQRCGTGCIEGVEIQATVRVQELAHGLGVAHGSMHEQLMLGVCSISIAMLRALPMLALRFLCFSRLVALAAFGLAFVSVFVVPLPFASALRDV